MHHAHDFTNMEDLVPFPILEEQTDHFDYYLDKMNNEYRYLLAFVADRAGPEKVDELSFILAASKSKYASDIWVGQEELYQSLESILNKLRQEPSHKCFLQKVTPKEAPDYHLIIKHPMDLGKMSKKLKDGHYKSKQDFRDDIQLIHDNCHLYNKHPDSPYQGFARSLLNMTIQLLLDVPNTVIRHRDELSPDELKQWLGNKSKAFLTSDASPPLLRTPNLAFNPLPSLYQIPPQKIPNSPSNKA